MGVGACKGVGVDMAVCRVGMGVGVGVDMGVGACMGVGLTVYMGVGRVWV